MATTIPDYSGLPLRPVPAPDFQAAGNIRTPLPFWLALVVVAALYTLSQFPGLEYHPSYFGNAYQAIHPADSFIGDLYMKPARPTLLSAFYLIAKAAGDWWLDDRFTILVYLGLALFALVTIDKMARLCGLTATSDRLIVLALMILEHRFRGNQADVVSHWDFNATMMAGPLAIALLYQALSGAKLLRQLATAAALVLVSMKVCWVPILIALLIYVKERLKPRQKVIFFGFSALFAVAGFGFYRAALHTPIHPVVFDYLLANTDDVEANPFLDDIVNNILFLALAAGGLLVRLPDASVQRRVRTVAAIAIGLFFVGGAYLSYSPDVLKIPYFVPIDVNRGLFWPQLVLFMGLASWAIRRHSGFPGSWLGATLLLFTLYVINTGLKRQAVIAATAVAVLTAYACLVKVRAGRWSLLLTDRAVWSRGIAAAFLTTTVLYLGTVTLVRMPALVFLAKYGIVGDNPGAKWVGVNEYLRAHTPPDAVVFSMATYEYPWRAPERLTYAQSLRTRSGRTMQAGHDVSDHFNYDFLLWNRRRGEQIASVVVSWNLENYDGLMQAFQAIGLPDYIVAPETGVQWLANHRDFPFTMAATVTSPRTPPWPFGGQKVSPFETEAASRVYVILKKKT